MQKKSIRRAGAAVGAVLGAVAALAGSAGSAAAVEGGTPTTTAAAPYAVLIELPTGTEFCGGTLIAPNEVLTAAHCVSDSPVAATSLVIIGGRTDVHSTAGLVRHATAVKVDPKYVPSELLHDAAVLTLNAPLPYKTLPIAPAGDTALYRNGNTATLFGWGEVGPNQEAATQLKTAQLSLQPLASCSPWNLPTDTPALKLCGRPVPGTANSTCPGDSGGPLVEDGYLIGIVSAGNKTCDGTQPDSVFTKAGAIAPELGLKG